MAISNRMHLVNRVIAFERGSVQVIPLMAFEHSMDAKDTMARLDDAVEDLLTHYPETMNFLRDMGITSIAHEVNEMKLRKAPPLETQTPKVEIIGG